MGRIGTRERNNISFYFATLSAFNVQKKEDRFSMKVSLIGVIENDSINWQLPMKIY